MTSLVFTLQAPLASFGRPGKGSTHRLSSDHPGRSMVFGLLGACLGIKREDEEAMRELQKSYAMCVAQPRHKRPGAVSMIDYRSAVSMIDYHTVQTPSQSKYKSVLRHSRKAEVDTVLKCGEHTTLTFREYVQDYKGCILLAPRIKTMDYDFPRLQKALVAPKYFPYIGRKSNSLSSYFFPQILEADSIKQAIRNYLENFTNIRDFNYDLFADEELLPTHDHLMINEVYDEAYSREKWSFESRREVFAFLETGGNNGA